MNTRYLVQPGDNLVKIAEMQLGNPYRWAELVHLNGLQPPYDLLIGQPISLPGMPQVVQRGGIGNKRADSSRLLISGAAPMVAPQRGADTMPGRAFLFILADEILPSGKVVRKVMIPADASIPAVEAIIRENPLEYGMRPWDPNAQVSLGEHSLGNTKSPYLSASTNRRGAPNFDGTRFYIDIAKAEAAGVTIHPSAEIVADLDRMVGEQPNLNSAGRVDKLKYMIEHVEREVLLEGYVPPDAIKSGTSMALTRGLRYVQTVGMIVTVYDLGNATVKSVKQNSVKPIAAEGIRQAGGWGGAWLGFKIGGGMGFLVGIETGPGAILAGAGGALVGGFLGYWGLDWFVADSIDEN
jgi:LysM domain